MFNKQGRTWASRNGLYTSKSWRHLRAEVLRDEPFCRICRKLKMRTPAKMVDHIIPITEENWEELFIDIKNLQPLCDPCHGFKTQRDRGNDKRKVIDMDKILGIS